MLTKDYGPFDLVDEFRPGDRIEIHPATDLWMSGDRYATIEAIGTKRMQIRMDRSGRGYLLRPTSVGAKLVEMGV